MLRLSLLLALAALAFSSVSVHARADDLPRDDSVTKRQSSWPPLREVREQGESPLYYRAPKPIVGIGLRPSLKGLVRVAAADERSTLAFGLDAHLVGRFGLGRSTRAFGVWPEAGYAYSGSDGHFASLGIGPAVQTPTPWLEPIPDGLSFGVVPHLLLGSRDDRTTVGLRTSAIAEVYFDDGNAWGLELCHQMTQTGDTMIHELIFGISLTAIVHRWQR